jgi:hypothetical protein
MTKTERLRELDAEFDGVENRWSGRMQLSEYLLRRAEIEAELDPAPALASPAPKARPGVSRKQLEALATALGKAVGPYLESRLAPLEARIAELENRQADPQRALPLGPRRVA